MQEELDPKWSVERAVLAAKMPASSKLVMLVMLTHAHHPRDLYLNGSSPGLRKLAEETGLVYKSVQTHVRLLEANGWLKPHKARGKRSQYELAAGESFTMDGELASSSLPTGAVSSSPPKGELASSSVVSPSVAHSESLSSSRLEERDIQDQEKIFKGGKPEPRKPQTRITMTGPAPWDDDFQQPDSLTAYEQDMASRRNLEPYDLTPMKPDPAPEPQTFDELLGPAQNDDYDFQRLLDLTF